MGNVEYSILGKVLDVNRIMDILPHRYPFLFVDRIVEVEEKKVVGIKNVTINEPFFQGHFPGHPILPGVVIIEAMAQVGGVAALNMKENVGKLAYFLSIDNAKFRKPVVPGDVLRIEVEFIKAKMGIVKVHGIAKVENETAAEADLMFAFVNPETEKK